MGEAPGRYREILPTRLVWTYILATDVSLIQPSVLDAPGALAPRSGGPVQLTGAGEPRRR